MNLGAKLHALSSRKQSSILSASIVLAVTFGLSAILGFLRSRFLYARFFNCCVMELDAYNAAFRLPDLIFKLLVTGALSASFIPVFSTYLHKDESKAYEIASTVINLLLIVFTLASVTVLIFAKPLSGIIAAGFTGEQLALMTNLTRILLIAQIFFLISNFLTGMLQVHQVFIVPALSPIVYNIFIILSIFFLVPNFGIYGVVIGTVIGAFFHLAIQIPVAKAMGVRYTFSLNPQLAGVKEVIRLMIPRSLSLGLGEIENTVTLFFASTLAAGSISLLNLALQLMYLPSRIFGTTVGQASLPILSKNIAKNELVEFRDTVRKTISQSLFIAIPITTLVLIHRLAIIRIAFGTRQFPWSATLLTAKTLAFLTPAIVCQAIIQILIRAFYAIHDTRTPLKISTLSLLINITSSYLTVNYTNLGILGLAISASLGNLTQCIGLFYQFIRKVDGGGWVDTFWHYTKIVIASVVLGFTSWISMRFFDMFVIDSSHTLNLLILSSISVSISIVFYYYTAKLLHISEINDYQYYTKKLSKFFQK
jgi:putative peptidoglycan lipid II flippase